MLRELTEIFMNLLKITLILLVSCCEPNSKPDSDGMGM